MPSVQQTLVTVFLERTDEFGSERRAIIRRHLTGPARRQVHPAPFTAAFGGC